MPGEPEWFDVTKLEAIEIDEPGVEFPSNIIDWGEDFYLKATFEGHGPLWDNMTQNGFQYIAQFYAEGMGPGVADQNFGSTQGNLVPGQPQYQVNSPVANIEAEGVWRCGVMVTFRTADAGRWYGVLGYNEDCVIQMSILEELG
jgi:hypothetical protein